MTRRVLMRFTPLGANTTLNSTDLAERKRTPPSQLAATLGCSPSLRVLTFAISSFFNQDGNLGGRPLTPSLLVVIRTGLTPCVRAKKMICWGLNFYTIRLTVGAMWAAAV